MFGIDSVKAWVRDMIQEAVRDTLHDVAHHVLRNTIADLIDTTRFSEDQREHLRKGYEAELKAYRRHKEAECEKLMKANNDLARRVADLAETMRGKGATVVKGEQPAVTPESSEESFTRILLGVTDTGKFELRTIDPLCQKMQEIVDDAQK